MDRDPWSRPPTGGDRRQSPNRPPRRRLGRLVWWIGGIGVLLLALGLLFPQARGGMGLIYSVILLVTIGSAIVVSLRMGLGEFARNAAIWAGIILLLSVAYAFRSEIGYIGQRVAGAANPARGYSAGDAMVFERGRDGHFHVQAEIAGKPVDFLVDTGASNVVIAPRDARRLGLRPPRDQFFERYYTANGAIMAAPVLLDSVRIGDIEVARVRASVVESDLRVSLMGMSFLDKLGGVEISGDRLVLRP